MISPATIERLLAVDMSSIRIPYSSEKTSSGENKDIYYFKNVLRFIPFCRDLDDLHEKSSGLIVGRALAEAAWCKTVIKVYKRMDVEEQKRVGERFWNNLQCVNDCLRQLSLDDSN